MLCRRYDRRCRRHGGYRRRRGRGGTRSVSLPFLLLRQFRDHLIDVGSSALRGRDGSWRHSWFRRSRRLCWWAACGSVVVVGKRLLLRSSDAGQNLLLSVGVDDDGRYELVILELLTTRYEALQVWRIRVALAVDQEGRRHQMRGQLRLLVEYVMVRVANQWPVIRVEEYCLG